VTWVETGHTPINIVLADANVLYSRVLRDYLLCAAEQNLVNVVWSQSILNDVTEHLILNLPAFTRQSATALANALDRTFPNAIVEPTPADYARLETFELPDEDDRAVIAAAIAAEADIVCTNNIKHFPLPVMEHLGLVLLTPDELFVQLINTDTERMIAAHRSAITSHHQFTDQSTIASLRRAGAPATADLMATILGF